MWEGRSKADVKMVSLTPNINEMNKHKNKNDSSKDVDGQGQGFEHRYDYDELVGQTGDEDQVGIATATQAPASAARGSHGPRRKSYSASISVSDLVKAKKTKYKDEEVFDLKQTIITSTHQGVNFLRSLGTGWSLVLLDLFFGIPISLTLTYLNKAIISYLGYEKIMRCPSGILGSRIFFVVINAILVVHWGLQLNEEERVEGEIGHWTEVCAFLEGERERIEERVAGEVEEQLMVESFGSHHPLHDLRFGGEGVKGEETIPKIPSTVQRRVIRPAVGSGLGSVVPKTGSSLRREVTAGVIDPDSLMDVKQIKTKPNKMTVGRKAGLRIREEQSRRFGGEDDGERGDGEESD